MWRNHVQKFKIALPSSFPHLQSRCRIKSSPYAYAYVFSLAFALRHTNNISTRRTNQVRSSCAYGLRLCRGYFHLLLRVFHLCLCAGEDHP